MNLWTVYNTTTGAIVLSLFGVNVAAPTPGAGQALLEGVLGNPQTQQVNLTTLQLEAIPPS
jgi:hypothetical protein